MQIKNAGKAQQNITENLRGLLAASSENLYVAFFLPQKDADKNRGKTAEFT